MSTEYCYQYTAIKFISSTNIVPTFSPRIFLLNLFLYILELCANGVHQHPKLYLIVFTLSSYQNILLNTNNQFSSSTKIRWEKDTISVRTDHEIKKRFTRRNGNNPFCSFKRSFVSWQSCNNLVCCVGKILECDKKIFLDLWVTMVSK